MNILSTKNSLIAALTLIVLPFAFSGCKTSSDPFATGDFQVDSVKYSYTDKVMLTLTEPVEDQDSTLIQVDMDIDWPKSTGKNIVSVNAVRDWLQEHLSSLNQYKKIYEGNIDDASALVKFYGDSYKEAFEQSNEFPAPALTYELSFKKNFENSKCVTFMYALDVYLGGAHGSRTDYGITFRKSDGKIMRDFLTLADVTDDGLNKLIKKGLMDYWGLSDEEMLYEYCWENSVSKYYAAQPHTPPCFVKDGILFCYQEYEIAAYAAGAPSFVVPYSEIKKYLTPSAQALISD